MRLHRLTLTAFGPFPGREEIDFDALSADGLFLLHGRTGSGKTTVLDAVTFALYGDVPGQRDVAGLRSHHAPPGREPSVELEFTQGGCRWMIRRTPPYLRPSRRAKAGVVPQNQTVVLKVHRSGQWQEVTSGVQAASHEIRDILPLDRHQFTQVILLPQGEFAQFLHANSAEKQKLLQKLFDTALYQRLETGLNERAKDLRERIGRADQRVEATAQGVHTAAQAMVRPVLGEELSRFTAVEPEDLADTVELLAAWLARDLEQNEQLAAADSRAASQRAEQLREDRTVLQKLAALEEQRATHESRRAVVQRHRRELTRHEHAVEVLRWFDHADRLDQEAGNRRQSTLAQLSALQEALAGQDDVDAAGTAAAALVTAEGDPDVGPLHRLLTELAHVCGGLQEQDAARAEVHRRDVLSELARARRQADQEQATCRRLDEVIAGLDAQEQQILRVWQDPEDLEQRLSGSAELLSLHGRRTELAEQLSGRRQKAEQAAGRAQEVARAEEAAEEDRRRLLTGHLKAVARRLAADLVEGEPCLVCGSTEHPHPAGSPSPPAGEPPTTHDVAEDQPVEEDRPGEVTIGEDDVEQATARLHEAARLRARADSAQETARESLRELEEELDALSRQLRATALGDAAAETPVAARPTDAVVEEAAAEHTEARRRHEEWQQRLRDQRRRETELSRLREELAASRSQRLSAAHAAERTTAEAARLRQDLEALDEVLSRLRGSHGSVEERLAALESLQARCREAETSLNRWREQEHAAQQARASARRQLQESPLTMSEEADDAGVEAAVLDEATVDAYREAVDDWEREAQRLELTDQTPEIVTARSLRAAGHAVPQEATVQAAEEQAESAAARHDQARSDRERFEDRFQAAVDACRRLSAALQARDEELQEHRRLAELAATLNGTGPDNPRRMTLTSYVLAARLEKVAVAATRHLQTMSEGRYRLRHDDAEGPGRRHGLELKVHDEHSDHERPTSSLSGGETFMASLAMALGLAEVVQSEAGGVGLETLFIDEGFGSLDEESLDHVMVALHRLQGEGRRVGVVSHVTEMHRAIPTQLQILRRRTGSTVRMLIPGVIDSPQHEQQESRAEEVLSGP
ncbi:AAA family ATPase [Nesterenkonia suensis]